MLEWILKKWWEGLDWINMSQGRDWGLAVVNVVMNVYKVQQQLDVQLFLFVNERFGLSCRPSVGSLEGF